MEVSRQSTPPKYSVKRSSALENFMKQMAKCVKTLEESADECETQSTEEKTKQKNFAKSPTTLQQQVIKKRLLKKQPFKSHLFQEQNEMKKNSSLTRSKFESQQRVGLIQKLNLDSEMTEQQKREHFSEVKKELNKRMQIIRNRRMKKLQQGQTTQNTDINYAPKKIKL